MSFAWTARLTSGMAEAWQRGDLATALGLQLNIYPIILMLLHKLGLPWELAGKFWGVLTATLAVAPLYGWVRRQFDERVAIIACLLYAIHPELIEWSPELVRDSTFWFFFTLSFYLIWRAVTEVKLWLFLLAGASIAASALTRFEGLFLLIPLTIWTASRWMALSEGRPRLLGGATLGICALPALLLLINLVCIGSSRPWEALRLEPLARAQSWIASWSQPAPEPTTAAGPQPDLSPSHSLRRAPRQLAWQFVHVLERGMTPLHGLLFLGGYLAWLRLFNRRDHAGLTFTTLSICAGIWIHLWYTNGVSSRYVLGIVIMSTPVATMGLLSLDRWISGWVRFVVPRLQPQGWIVGTLLLALLVMGWTDALTTKLDTRTIRADLGQWIHRQCGNQPLIIGTDEQLPVVAFYAHASCSQIPAELHGASFVDWVSQYHPDVLILSDRGTRPSDREAIMNEQQRLGLKRVDPTLLPDGLGRTVVLTRVARR